MPAQLVEAAVAQLALALPVLVDFDLADLVALSHPHSIKHYHYLL
jgi:hypothetical protein